MRSPARRIRANVYFLRKPFVEFLPVLVGMIVILLAGGFAFRSLYPEAAPTYTDGLYLTYCLIFMEHLVALPDHWLLQTLYFVLPPLGLAVILDGIVRFSYHILNRDETSAAWGRAMSKTMKDHVVLFGLGKLGLRVLQELIKLNELVSVVERNPNCPNIAFARKHGVPVRVATGREEGLLEELNLGAAKSLIMATDDDLVNLEVAIDARVLKPKLRIVMRLFDQELAAKIRDAFDLKLTFSTSELAAPLFATASSDRSILNSFYIGDQLMLVAKMRIEEGSALAGKSVAQVRTEYETIVLDLQREGDARFFPDGPDVLAVGDRVSIQTGPARLRRIQEANHSTPI